MEPDRLDRAITLEEYKQMTDKELEQLVRDEYGDWDEDEDDAPR